MSLDASVMYTLLFISLYFEVFLLVSFLRKKFERTTAPLEVAQPRVAVIVPCYNEERTVTATIESLLALDYPVEKIEIIAVDDGSCDDTLAILRGFEPRIRVLAKENGGKHTALNLALAHTDAELIACLDADSIVDVDALRRLVLVFDDSRVAAVTPGIHTKRPETLLQHAQYVEYRLSIFNRFVLAALGSAFIAPGPFSMFRASVVSELGGWRHGHSTEDMEMALRIQSAGHLIGNAPRAIVHTSTPRTLRTLFRQRVRWSYGFLRNAVDYRHMLGNRAYGNLGIIVLPLALITIGTAIFFFARFTLDTLSGLGSAVTRYEITGSLPHPSLNLFYLNTSAMLIVIYTCVLLVLALIATGSWISTGSRRIPLATPLFMMVYCFVAPLWLFTALVRATFKTGVQWK